MKVSGGVSPDPATLSEFEHAPLLIEPKSESNGGIGHVVFILSVRFGPHFVETCMAVLCTE
jgi:hypothetical protein